MFRRHPILSVLTVAYLAFVGWLTLSPKTSAGGFMELGYRLLEAVQRRGFLLSLSESRLEFLANVGLFVPIGMFLLLLFGTRKWWLAVLVSFALTVGIEAVQNGIPGRVSDARDLIANGSGAIIGIVLALILTAPGAWRRHRERQAAVPVGIR